MENLMTMRETAQYLRISYNTIKKHWPKYINFGVTPVRYLGQRNIMFRKEELDQMINKWRVA